MIDGCEGVVRDVEFFEVEQGGEAGDSSKAVGFDIENFEHGEVGNVLGCFSVGRGEERGATDLNFGDFVLT